MENFCEHNSEQEPNEIKQLLLRTINAFIFGKNDKSMCLLKTFSTDKFYSLFCDFFY